MAILVYRRRTTGPVFRATTRNDKAMYVVLVAAIVAGLVTTLLGAGATGEAHNYRLTVSPWFRSLFVLRPDVEAMARSDVAFQVHALIGMLLVRDVAVHPARPRVQRTRRLPVPALRRLPPPRGRAADPGHPTRAARLGATRQL